MLFFLGGGIRNLRLYFKEVKPYYTRQGIGLGRGGGLWCFVHSEPMDGCTKDLLVVLFVYFNFSSLEFVPQIQKLIGLRLDLIFSPNNSKILLMNLSNYGLLLTISISEHSIYSLCFRFCNVGSFYILFL